MATTEFTITMRPRDVGRLVARKRDAAAAAIRGGLESGVDEVAGRALQRVVEFTPMDTGEAREGWAVQRSRERASFRLYNRLSRTRAGAAKIRAIEFGGPPHEITARRMRVLRFRGDDAKAVFRRRVMHPGTRAYAPLRLARGLAQVELAELARRIGRVVKEVWGRTS